MPLVVFRSVEDHGRTDIPQIITQRVSSRDVTSEFDNSYRVATLDFDADSIFTESVEFIRSSPPSAPDV